MTRFRIGIFMTHFLYDNAYTQTCNLTGGFCDLGYKQLTDGNTFGETCVPPVSITGANDTSKDNLEIVP